MSDPSQRSSTNEDVDSDREPTDRTAKTREDELIEAEARKPAGPNARETTAAEEKAEAEEDAEEVKSEWHFWIFALLVVAGIALFFAPRFFLPELLVSLGAFLVTIGVLGWVIKWAIERSA